MKKTERLTLNMLLSLVIQAKKQGKGKLGNGRLLVAMLRVIADRTDGHSRERSVLSCFCDEPVKSCAYQKIDKQLVKFFKSGTPYPYEKLGFAAFAASLYDTGRYLPYFHEMCAVYDTIISPEKSESLVFTLLELLRRDPAAEWVLYGTQYLKKESLLGDAAHRKKICAPALVFGLLYQLHSQPLYAPPVPLKEPPVIPPFVLTNHAEACPDAAALSDFLNPNRTPPPAQILSDNAHRFYAHDAQTGFPVWPLTLRSEDRELSALPQHENIFLYGADGAGKSTFLRAAFRGEDVIYLSLSGYQPCDSAYDGQHSIGLLLMILLRFRYCGKYHSYEALTASEDEQIILRQLSESDAALSQSACTLILDDFEAVPPRLTDALLSELAYDTEKWQHTRWIICGSAMPSHTLFRRFTPVECIGFSNTALSELLPQNMPNPMHELLRLPLLYAIWRENEMRSESTQNCALLLDSYFLKSGKPLADTRAEQMRQFLIRFALPFAAFDTLHRGHSVISRADLSAAIGKAVSFYLKNDRVYQNYTSSHNLQKNLLPEGSREDDWFAVLRNMSFLCADSNEPHLLRFSHRVYAEYFAARHIIRASEALEAAYARYSLSALERELARLGLDELWFPEEMTGAYLMTGELAGDDQNRPCADFFRLRTVLDTMLDWAREIRTFRLTESVMRTMAVTRGNVICEADFRDLALPMWIPATWKFSLNGEYPSRFAGCRAGLFGLIDGDISLRISPDGTQMLFCFPDGYSALFDAQSDTLLSEYAGALPAFAVQWQTAPCTDDLRLRLYAVLPHFRGCDFSGARIFTDAAKQFLPVLCRTVP